jgi:DNA-binding Xre family transcriptional regulator
LYDTHIITVIIMKVKPKPAILQEFLNHDYNTPAVDAIQLIAERVRELRRARGLDQRELARRAGVSMQTVSNLETGRLRDLKVSTLAALAGSLGVSPAELLRRSDARSS